MIEAKIKIYEWIKEDSIFGFDQGADYWINDARNNEFLLHKMCE